MTSATDFAKHAQEAFELCPRTLALWRPGEKMAGVHHTFAYNGKIPMTGTERCTLCGKVKT